MSIENTIEEVDVRIDTNFLNEFSETESSTFRRKVIENLNSIDMNLLKKRTDNCTPKTMKVIRGNQEIVLCIGKRGISCEEDGCDVHVQQE